MVRKTRTLAALKRPAPAASTFKGKKVIELHQDGLINNAMPPMSVMAFCEDNARGAVLRYAS